MLGDLLKHKTSIWCFIPKIKISPVWKISWLSTFMYIYLIYLTITVSALAEYLEKQEEKEIITISLKLTTSANNN